MRWQQRVDELLYDGETVDETVSVESSEVVVTSHRVLAFTPERDGENLQQADRPNVSGVEMGSEGGRRFLRWAIILAVFGVPSLVVGVIFDSESVFSRPDALDSEGADSLGGGSLVDIVRTMFDVLAMLDTILLGIGVIGLLLAGALGVVYGVVERSPALIIRVAGDESNLHLPRPEVEGDYVAELERTVLPESAASDTAGGFEDSQSATDSSEDPLASGDGSEDSDAWSE